MRRNLLLLFTLLAACDDTGESDTGDGPNLVVSGFFVEDRGDSYEFVAIVENLGNVAADTFSVDLFVDRTTEPREGQTGDLSQQVYAGLGAGEVVDVTFTVTGVEVGERAWVYVDSTGVVPELYEDDNTASTEIARRRR